MLLVCFKLNQCVGQYLKLNDPEQIALTGLSGGSSDDTIDSGKFPLFQAMFVSKQV